MNVQSTDAPNVGFPPSLAVLAAHAVVSGTKAKALFKQLYRGSPDQVVDNYPLHLSEAVTLGLVDDSKGHSPTKKGFLILRKWMPDFDDDRLSLTPKLFVQLFAASNLLQTHATKSAAKQLANPNVLIAGYLARSIAPQRFKGLQATARKTIDAAAHAIAEKKIADAFPGIDLDNTNPLRNTVNPIAHAVFLQVMKSPSGKAEEAFRDGFEMLFNTRVTGAASTWWGPILATAARSQMPNMRFNDVLDEDFLSVLLSSTRVAAAEGTSGWLPIADAFNKFQATKRIALEEFKKQLVEAALEGQVELSPLNVSSSLPSQLREQSATEFGGRTYHFLRISRRRSVA